MKNISPDPSFPSILQDFFCKRLINQMNASPRTIESYRDTFRILLRYAADRLRKQPVTIRLNDLDSSLILDFLDYLEKKRGNSIRTRNARLAAIRSFARYASAREPGWLAIAERLLSIPPKRFHRPLVGFLSKEEIHAVIDAPDASTWSGRRDRVMFATMYNVGARVSEVVGMQVQDLVVGRSPHIRIHGKGRKERTVPIWKETALRLNKWLKHTDSRPDAPLFPNRLGQPLSRSGIENRLKQAVQIATKECGSLSGRLISPHVLRHTTAMHLLQAGVDFAVIALWLGHESSSTTHIYVEADISIKESALGKIHAPSARDVRYRAPDKVLRFLESL